MRQSILLAVTSTALLFGAQAACGSDGGSPAATTQSEAGPATSPSPTSPNPALGGSLTDGGVDPRCATQATFIGTHPHASQQPTPLGKQILDVRGWKGQLYFGYGDFEANTGPIYITTLDPKTKSWTEHAVSYKENGTGQIKTTPAFGTHTIERFFPVGDSLWAPASQPYFGAPFDPSSAPEYAIATGGHDWSQVDIAPNAIHVVGVVERAPGDVYVTGSGVMHTDTAVGAAANGRAGGHIWRSTNGGPFTQLFPNFEISTPESQYYDITGAWISGAALNGVAYFDEAGFIMKHDGGAWDFWENFGEFLTPATFAGHLVFADLGQFFAFDGAKRKNLDFKFFESQGRYNTMKEPLALFQVTEGRLLAVKYGGDVMMTTDLQNWSCIGKAPADATAVGSLDGVVYFGSVNSGVYGFPAPSW